MGFSCHAGGQVDFLKVKSPLPDSIIEKFKESSGKVIIASSRKNEVSWTGHPYSVFTNALIEAFAGYGSFEEDGFVHILDLSLYVSRKVAERTDDKQHPIIKVENLQNNFALSWYAAGEKKVLPLPSSTSLPPSIGIYKQQEIESIKIQINNYKENLLIIEERISEYIDYIDVPLQLIKSKRIFEKKLTDLEKQIQNY